MAGTLQRLRQKIINREYELTKHAEEEARKDWLERTDIEYAILKGKIDKKLTGDPRGPRYRIEGPSKDGRVIHVVCRLDAADRLRIITVYALGNGGDHDL